MRILQLISSGGLYGAESVLLNLSLELQRLGHSCSVAVFENSQNPNTELAQRAESLGLTTRRISCRGQFDWSAVRTIRSIAVEESIDLIHAHGYKADFYAYAASRPLGLPLVATCHNWPGRSMTMRFYASLDQFVLRRFDRVAAVSERVAEQLQQPKSHGRVQQIANGVPTPGSPSAARLAPVTSMRNGLVVGTVGRLSSEKGLSFLVQAAQKLSHDFPDTLYVLVGDGTERAALESQVRVLGLTGRVIFEGERSDMQGVYASFDVFVLASLTEGMPMVVLEAMAARLPVVATRVGAIPQLIPDASFGILVEPGNAEALAEGIGTLLRDAALREHVGQNAQDRVQQFFSSARMAERYVEIYHQAFKHRGTPKNLPEVPASSKKTRGAHGTGS